MKNSILVAFVALVAALLPTPAVRAASGSLNSPGSQGGPIRATTDDGRIVILNPDGTWTLAPRLDSGRTVKSHGFKFELERIEQSGLCTLFVSNENDRDVELYFSIDGSRLMDNEGNTFRSQTDTTVGNQKNRALLAVGVRTKLTIRFKEVSSQSTRATVLSLRMAASGISNTYFQVEFRDIDIEE